MPRKLTLEEKRQSNASRRESQRAVWAQRKEQEQGQRSRVQEQRRNAQLPDPFIDAAASSSSYE